MPAVPDIYALTAMLLAAAALVLFTRQSIPLESSALLLLIIMALASLWLPLDEGAIRLSPADLYSGFGNEALVAIVCLMLCAKGLEQTGALHDLAQVLGRAWSHSPRAAFLITLVASAVCSMFLNNTPIVAMMLPLLVSVSIRQRIPSSGILMPVGYATILGGMTTSIGTSTNLLVVGIAQDLGQPGFGLFDFFLPASMGAGAAIVFLWLVAPRLIPARTPPMPQTSPRVFQAVLHIPEDSKFVDRTLADALEATGGSMKVQHVERGESLRLAKLPTLHLKAGDRLYLRDTPDRLKEYELSLQARLLLDEPEDAPPGDTGVQGSGGQQLAEIVITASSYLNNHRLEDLDLLQGHRLLPIALHRPGMEPSSKPEEAMLRTGDVLLVQGTLPDIQSMKRKAEVLVLDGTMDLVRSRLAPVAVLVMAAVVVLAGTGLMPISSAALAGVVAMLLSGCLTPAQLRRSVDFPIIMVIVASLALGKYLTVSGAALYTAELFIDASAAMPAAARISMLMLCMALLTELVTNNAAAAIGTPVAISIATSLGVPAEPFILAVLLGGNMSYMTPIGYQTNLLVMSAGGYRFSDFLRVGIPLQIVTWVTLSAALAWYYDLAW